MLLLRIVYIRMKYANKQPEVSADSHKRFRFSGLTGKRELRNVFHEGRNVHQDLGNIYIEYGNIHYVDWYS
jgi:hypothetical protein